MDCIATSFTGLDNCRQAVGGVFELYVGLWSDNLKENLDIDGNFISGSTKKIAWKNLPVNQISQADNDFQSEGKFINTITFEVAGYYIEDRSVKEWLNYNKLVFVFVGGNGQAFIAGEENGFKVQSFKDSTSGSSAQWTFTANTTYSNYGITSEFLDKIKETADCGDYTALLALNNTTTIQEQFDCLVGDYVGFIP